MKRLRTKPVVLEKHQVLNNIQRVLDECFQKMDLLFQKNPMILSKIEKQFRYVFPYMSNIKQIVNTLPVYRNFFYNQKRNLILPQPYYIEELKEGVNIVPISLVHNPEKNGHANFFLIRKDKNELTTLYLEPYGYFNLKLHHDCLKQAEKYPRHLEMFQKLNRDPEELLQWVRDGYPGVDEEADDEIFICLILGEMDQQELIVKNLEHSVNLFAEEKGFEVSHLGLDKKLDVQYYEDEKGYCESLLLVAVLFSFLLEKCNKKKCGYLSNAHFFQKLTDLIFLFSKTNKYNAKERHPKSFFCFDGGFLCKMNHFIYLYMLYTKVLPESDSYMYDQKLIDVIFQTTNELESYISML